MRLNTGDHVNTQAIPNQQTNLHEFFEDLQLNIVCADNYNYNIEALRLVF